MDRQIDPLLADILGATQDDSELGGEDTDTGLDPVGNWRHQIQYGIRAEGAKPEPKTIAQISKALDNVRQDLAVAPSEAKQAFYRKMAAAAELYAPGTFAAHFLKGAAESDDLAMRKAVKRLVQEHKDEILVSGSLEKLLVVE